MRRLWLELGVLATLLVSFLTVPLPLPHVASATVWAALTCAHVARRRRVYAALLRSARRTGRRRRVVATTALIGCAGVVTLSGFAQWAGVAAATPWHAASSTLLVVLAVSHAARRLWWLRRSRANRHSAPNSAGATPRQRGTGWISSSKSAVRNVTVK